MLTDPKLGNLHLDPPQDLVDNVYLGTKQTMCQVPESLIKEKNELYKILFERKGDISKTISQKDDDKDQVLSVTLLKNQADGPIPMLPSPNEEKKVVKPRSRPKEHVRPKNIQGYQYDLTGNASDCVERYLDLSGVKRDKLKPVATPCLDDTQIPLNDHEIQGSLHAECSKIVLKFLWIARLTRPDIFGP